MDENFISFRKCQDCGYRTIVMEDKNVVRGCKWCGGLLKIIVKGEMEEYER